MEGVVAFCMENANHIWLQRLKNMLQRFDKEGAIVDLPHLSENDQNKSKAHVDGRFDLSIRMCFRDFIINRCFEER